MSDGINDCSSDEYRYKSDRKPVPSGTQDEREREIRSKAIDNDHRYLLSLLDAERKRVQELYAVLRKLYNYKRLFDKAEWNEELADAMNEAESILPKEQS